ncbi:hypothetical protein D3C84_383960 [compost metagenome]
MEEELRQAVGQQVGLAAEALLFRRARTGDDLDAFLAVDLLRLDRADEGQCLGNQRLQFGEGGFAVVVLRQLDFSQTTGNTLAEINGDLHLTHQREHVREQARLQERVRVDVFFGGVSLGLFQYIAQGVEHLLENRHGSVVQGNGHGRSRVVTGGIAGNLWERACSRWT